MVSEFPQAVLAHLSQQLSANEAVMTFIRDQLVQLVPSGGVLFAAGSGHSALFAMELYHRAGGPSFVVPVLDPSVLPIMGPSRARAAERQAKTLLGPLHAARPKKGEMIWISSQSGMNPAIVELAVEARRLGLVTVAFTSLAHSRSGKSRHASGKRLFEVADHVVDIGGVKGDALIPVAGASRQVAVGPFSTLSSLFLAHTILADVSAELERRGVHCTYTSVNTPDGESQNRELEKAASVRDPRLTLE